MDKGRRNFIKGAAGLAALTVAGVVAPSLFKVSELERQVQSGFVRGQTFYINKPIVLDMSDLLITDCHFIATADLDHFIVVRPTAKRCVVTNCSFDSNGHTIGGFHAKVYST